jgi:hypothetical protein
MGEFLRVDTGREKNEFGMKNIFPRDIYIEFVPGLVIDVVLNKNSSAYEDNNRNINSIIAMKHFGTKTELKQMVRTRYYPLLRGIVDVPIKGDPVLLCDFGGVNYYLGPLNSINSPNFNIDTLNTGFNPKNNNTAVKTKSTFREKFNIPKNYLIATVSRLQKEYKQILDDPKQINKGEDGSISKMDTHGDMILEGRYGNSLRIGSRGPFPLIAISNGRNGGEVVENIYDGSLISITSAGSILDHFETFQLASDSVEENPRLVAGGNNAEETQAFNYNFGNDGELPILGNQILINSDKITLNARNNNITLSSFINMDFGAGNNLTINTKNYMSIESSNIYLGKQAQEKIEPLVLGNKLKELLEEMVGIIETLKVTACIAGLSGPIDPTTIQKVTSLKNKLAAPDFWSEYHFIEENGQKTTGQEGQEAE